ncbi:MAG: hypothetical protein JST31_07645, partial [Actinobacteria bacterium]|nr:hypothetical protein [Actinomycetota bacterium]
MAGVHLLGVATTSQPGRSRGPDVLAREVVGAALADAGLSSAEVDGVAIAAADAGFTRGAEASLGERRRAYQCRCGLGTVALNSAWKAVSAGVGEVVVCVGFDGVAAPLSADGERLEAQAAAAREYFQHSGATERHLARVAAKNRRHGAANPSAPVSAEVGIEEVLASELLLWPLRRLMVAAPAHGAAAVVLGAAGRGRR